ncbi:unnamed protein product [Camellia sinensis]
MDEINSLIFHGCKLARDLELNLPNIANQPNMVLKSCDDIVRIFSAARDRLSGQGSSSTSYGSGGGGGLIHESQMAGIGGGGSGGGGMHEWLRFASSQAMDLLQAQYEVQGGSAEMGGGVDVSGGELGGGSGGGGGGEVQAMDVSDSSRGTSWQRQRRRKDDGNKRRVLMPAPRMGNTEIPPDDGYTWRKYGQKEILGSKYPRSYYRCTHQKLYNCPARKQVQRLDNDAYTFEVIYCANHTCHMSSTAPSIPPISPELLPQITQQQPTTTTHSPPPPPTSAPLATWLSMDINQSSGEGTSSFSADPRVHLFRDFGLRSGGGAAAGTSSGGAGPSSSTTRYGENQFPVADLADAMFNSGSSSNNSIDVIFSSMEDKWEPAPGEKKN